MPTIGERYPATVTRIEEDPKEGRIFVKCLGLLGDEDTEYPDPVDPVHDWGWFYIPDVGEEVEIEVVVKDDQAEGVRDQAFLDEPRIRWRSKRFVSAEGEQPRPINPEFTDTNYGKRRGFATPAGLVLLFDDTEGDEKISLAWKAGDKETRLEIDSTGTFTLTVEGGIELKMDQDENVSLTCKDLKLDADTSTLIKGAADAMVMGTTWAAARGTKNTAIGAAWQTAGVHWTAMGPAAATAATAMATPLVLAEIPTTAPILATFFGLLATAIPAGVAAVAAKGAIDAFEAGASTYLSTKAKVGT